jgi:hypothetical protein
LAERHAAASVRPAHTDKARVRVEAVAPIASTFRKGHGDVAAPCCACYARDGPVVISISDRRRGSLWLAADRYLAELHLVAETTLRSVSGTCDHHIDCGVSVKPANAFQICIRNHRSGMLNNHGSDSRPFSQIPFPQPLLPSDPFGCGQILSPQPTQ